MTAAPVMAHSKARWQVAGAAGGRCRWQVAGRWSKARPEEQVAAAGDTWQEPRLPASTGLARQVHGDWRFYTHNHKNPKKNAGWPRPGQCHLNGEQPCERVVGLPQPILQAIRHACSRGGGAGHTHEHGLLMRPLQEGRAPLGCSIILGVLRVFRFSGFVGF